MKRKLNLVGNKTLTVSLPSKWTKKYNLNKGDEIDLEEIGSSLRLNSANPKFIKKEIIIDIDNLISSLVWRCIRTSYIQGFDTIIIKFTQKTLPYTTKDRWLSMGDKTKIKTTDLLNQIGSYFMGMIILEQSSDKFVLKDIGSSDNIDILLLEKRTSLGLKRMLEKIIELLEVKNENEHNEVLNIEYNINNISDYALRVLNKRDFLENYDKLKFFTAIEDVGDSIFRIFKSIVKKNEKISKFEIDIFKELLEYYNDFHKAYFFYPNELSKVYVKIKLFRSKFKNINEVYEFKRIIDNLMEALEPHLIKKFETKFVEE